LLSTIGPIGVPFGGRPPPIAERRWPPGPIRVVRVFLAVVRLLRKPSGRVMLKMWAPRSGSL